MGPVGVLDRQVVKAERLLDLLQQRFVRLVEADPDEPAGVLQDVAHRVEGDVGDPAPLGVATDLTMALMGGDGSSFDVAEGAE